MSQKRVVEENIEKLSSLNIDRMFNETSIREVDGELVGFLNLLVDPNTGAILDLTRKVRWEEKAISTPILVKRKDLFDANAKTKLSLTDEKKDISLAAYAVLEESLHAFNHKI
jgi:hypothetical protein